MKKQTSCFALAPIAMAVFALASGQAHAQTEVKIGGKFDAGYQFKRTAALDAADGSCAAAGCWATTEALGDGGASTSRITVQAKEKIGESMEAFIDWDLRFGNVHEGKNASTAGGINSNDKKIGGIKGPFGKLAWGTQNIVNLQIADKPYMVNIKDMEIVKFGISKPRSSDLTNRVTEYATPVLTLGPVKMLAKANYAFGDQRKDGTDDATDKGSADASTIGYEMLISDQASMNYHIVKRASSSYSAKDGVTFSELDVTYKPSYLKGLRLSASYFVEKGYNPNQGAGFDGPAFKAKGLNYVIAYNWDKKWQVGLELARNMDMGSNRNSGRGFMFGGAYWLSSNVYLYGAVARADFESNTSIAGGKYDGTKAGFKDTLKRVDERYTRFGIVKEF